MSLNPLERQFREQWGSVANTGIVNLTLVWQTGQHEKANTQLPTSPVSL